MKKQLGELLKDAGVLDDAGLQKALARQRQSGKKLGETLVELKVPQGLIDKIMAIAESTRADVLNKPKK